ncbi:adenine methyltransferase [Helicobacter sp. 16-1353]|uniref:DNA adenine methylase n=1 Tax=Helicobacter sp. 16-1353 TaxID=2004996 RepID=UPI000DCE8C2C|nr:DNA adenine methylase [Helicobacter sp. 16-1353]RAX51820.1 adenine methyltransferase [Helicobacter sp. 16-1353]
MRFIGNKENLVARIYSVLQQHKAISQDSNFFDLFAGSASVGRFFKSNGFSVYSCDLLYFSYCLQMAYLANNTKPRFENLKDIFKKPDSTLFSSPYAQVLEFLNALKPQKGFIYENYSSSGTKDLSKPRMYFSDENASKIDAIRLQIEEWKIQDKITKQEYFILLATLIESVSYFANVAGVYAAFCKKWDKRALKDFRLKEINLIESNKEHRCFCGDSIKLLESFKDKIFDILYIDPPYNHRQYAPNYHLIETIARYDSPKIRGVAGIREWAEQKSNFCNKKLALNELEKIVKINNYKILILSYSSEGLMNKDSIDEVLKSAGNVAFTQTCYPRFKSNANNGTRFISEYLWILEK